MATHANALARETSPYLLQHAHNPVDWMPWGEEAFARARREGKPIFLSIGYSTCYWCHVMERQCFENEAIAALLNRHFVCIKVDREERPDVDDLYMTAVQAMTGRGGWPMSVFLVPPGAEEEKAEGGREKGEERGGRSEERGGTGSHAAGLVPFYAGTYFPPEPAHGMPGFPQVLQGVADVWRNRRDQVLQQADQIAAVVREHLDRREQPATPSAKLVQDAANQLAQSYDPTDGGFGGAPKFPQPCNLLFLLKVHQNHPNPDLWHALAYTLERMARGGMHDQIAGGFHRYSTDAQWLVPHFEKMLYDQAQLVEAYCVAQAVSPDPRIVGDPGLYPRIVRSTCDYVLREMTDPATGCFWSAQDAEVDGREGGNYLWTPAEVRAEFGAETVDGRSLADLALALYGLDQGPNFRDPHVHDAPPANVLYLPERPDAFARAHALTLDQALEAKAAIDQRLLAARARRKPPGTDDKVLVSWNGLMIAALARAGRELPEPRYVEAAARTARHILEHMRAADGGLYRTLRAGQVRIPAFLEDYAFLAHGLLELHRATADPHYLDAARDIMRMARERFAAPDGGYYDTLADQADLFVRTRALHDGAIPSGNSQMVHNLLDLYELAGDDAGLEQAVRDLRAATPALERLGASMAHMQHALLRALELAPQHFEMGGDTGVPGTDPRKSSKPQSSVPVVRATVLPERIDPAAAQTPLAITLHIAAGFHLGAHDPASLGLIGTALALEGAGFALEVTYPPGLEKRYAFADYPLRVYEGAVLLPALLRRTAPTAPAPTQVRGPRLVLSYQACTDRECRLPATLEVPLAFTSSS